MRAAAKINLLLGVGAQRPDGFHTLVTVYQAVSLYDDLTVTAADDLTVETDVASYIDRSHLPPAGHNIVDRAAAGLAALHGRPVGAKVRVDKSIPIAGGLAGGSADGAAALVALDRVHDLGTSDHDLLTLAAGLGSDVPFALHGGTALGEGHGEVVTPLTDEGSWWWVVVPSDEGMSTPAVYRHYDEVRPEAPLVPGPPDEILAALDERRPAPARGRSAQRPRAGGVRPPPRPRLADRGGRRRRRPARAAVGVRADLRVPLRVRRPCALGRRDPVRRP